MTEIVYNACHGGFGLSDEALLLYAKLKEISVYPETKGHHTTFWLTPKDKRTDTFGDILSYYEIDRADPVLIQVIKELGEEAYGDFSKLEIVDLPEGTYYRIDEYDGLESVLTIDDYEWKKA